MDLRETRESKGKLVLRETRESRERLVLRETRVSKVIKEKLDIRLILLPLPYRLHSFSASKMVTFFQQNYPNLALNFIMLQFNTMDQYNGDKGKSTPINEIRKQIEAAAASVIGFNDPKASQIWTDADNENLTRQNWKFATYRRVSGTPVFLMNGVRVFLPLNVDEMYNFIAQFIPN